MKTITYDIISIKKGIYFKWLTFYGTFLFEHPSIDMSIDIMSVDMFQ